MTRGHWEALRVWMRAERMLVAVLHAQAAAAGDEVARGRAAARRAALADVADQMSAIVREKRGRAFGQTCASRARQGWATRRRRAAREAAGHDA